MQEKTKRPNKIQYWGKLFLLLVVGAGIYFAFFAPRPPAEFADMAQYTGTIQVSHGNAIPQAELPADGSFALMDILTGAHFAANSSAEKADYTANIQLRFTNGAVISLACDDKAAYSRVQQGEMVGYYKLKRSVYEEIRQVIYSCFPDGVKYTDLQRWWEEYFAVACQTLMEEDFNSAREIAPVSVAAYTFQQMVADGSAQQYEVATNWGRYCVIPYRKFLAEAQKYFADGANETLKETAYYLEQDKSMVFAAPEAEQYGNREFGSCKDWQQTGGYRLAAVQRDLMGVLTAEVYDYNELGFHDAGEHTRTHYFTLLHGSDGRYRFVSKHSQIINPADVSVEGYFLNIGRIGAITPAILEKLDIHPAGELGGDMLLYYISVADPSVLTLIRVNSRTGGIVCEAQLTAEEGEGFWLVQADAARSQVKVLGDGGGWLLDERLQVKAKVSLPNGEVQPRSFDISSDGRLLCYTTSQGLYLYQAGEESPLLAAQHPGLGEDGSPVNLLYAPRFVVGDSQIVAANVDGEKVLYYTNIDLTDPAWEPEKEESLPASRTVGIYPETVLDCYMGEEYMVVLYPNRDTAEDASRYTVGSVHYFEEDVTLTFLLRNDEDAPGRIIYNDCIFYFERTSPPGAEDTAFELKILELGVNMNRISTGLRVVNAVPKVLAADGQGRVLFSFSSPSGSGMGIANQPPDAC